MIETIQLMPGVTLRCFPDTRFKQGCLSLQMLRPMCAQEAAMNALLPSVLLRGSRAHPNLRAITLALDELYGASVSAMVRRIGDRQTVGLFCSFLEDHFALPGDRVLEPMVRFWGELLLEPVTQGASFLPEYVESEKRNLISTIESDLNDKRTYAATRLLRLMCKNDSYGIPRLGEAQWVREIEPAALYRHYRCILAESPMELFYVGSAAPEQVAELLKKALAGIERKPVTLPPQTPFCPGDRGEQIAERMALSQAKLCMGFDTPITNQSPEFAAMQVMNTVFGGGMTSKLFMQVRERQSLCYAIGSGFYGAKGILTVSAGVDTDKLDTARDEILRQLDACRTGQITAEELAAAKESLLSGLRGIHDSAASIEGYYAVAAVSGLGLTPAQYAEKIRAVTAADVCAAAKTVTLHTEFRLEGGVA